MSNTIGDGTSQTPACAEPSPDAVVAAFLSEFGGKEGAIVLDAWWADGFIHVYVDGSRMNDCKYLDELGTVPHSGEYRGLRTTLALYPRQSR
jgi:hypothetical protein